MNEQDKKQFQVLMIGAGETYNKEITKPLLQIYFGALKDFEMESVTKAFNDHLVDVEHGTFFPKPADIVRLINKNKPSVEEKARLAWMAIIGEIGRTGVYQTLELDDKMGLAALENVGGWRKLCLSNQKNLPWIEKEFIAAYQTFEKTPVEMLPKSLPGLFDIKQAKQESFKGLQSLGEKLKNLQDKKLEVKDGD